MKLGRGVPGLRRGWGGAARPLSRLGWGGLAFVEAKVGRVGAGPGRGWGGGAWPLSRLRWGGGAWPWSRLGWGVPLRNGVVHRWRLTRSLNAVIGSFGILILGVLENEPPVRPRRMIVGGRCRCLRSGRCPAPAPEKWEVSSAGSGGVGCVQRRPPERSGVASVAPGVVVSSPSVPGAGKDGAPGPSLAGGRDIVRRRCRGAGR